MNIFYGLIRIYYSFKNFALKYFKLLFSFSVPSVRWLIRMRLKHFTSLMTIVLSLGLGLAMFPIISEFAFQKNDPNFAIKNLAIIVAVFLLVGLDLFKRLPPTRYAKISIGGMGVKDAFRITGYEIWKILIKFKIENQGLQNICQSLDKTKSLTKNQRNLINNYILQLESLENRQQRGLQNIIEIKKIIALNFQISQRRLCDYIFQFSPSIYSELLRKYISNWKEIIKIYDWGDVKTLDDDISVRYSELARSADRIFKNITSIIKYQIQILKFYKFHTYIHSIAHDWSTSSALKNYIEVFSEIAREKKVDYQKLRYIFIKRNSHPGFDLHRSCENFCEQYKSHLGNHYIKLKKLLLVIREDDRIRGKDDLTEKDNVNDEGTIKFVPEEYKRSLRAFFLKFHSQVVKCRGILINKFVNEYENIIDDITFDNTLIIIQGYSKTIRQIVKKGFPELSRKLKNPNTFPKIFLLKADNENEDMLTTRTMRYELRSDKGYPEIGKKLFAGDINYLKSILKPRLHTALFLGAECFDTDNAGKVKRAMHTKGISSSLLSIKKEIKEKTEIDCKVVLFAERYKQYDDLLKEKDFYKDHLEGIDIYNNGEIDYLISD